jgi:hypothetical protein
MSEVERRRAVRNDELVQVMPLVTEAKAGHHGKYATS